MTERMESWWRTAVSVAQVGLITIYYMLSARVNDVKEQLARVEAANVKQPDLPNANKRTVFKAYLFPVDDNVQTNDFEINFSDVHNRNDELSELMTDNAPDKLRTSRSYPLFNAIAYRKDKPDENR